MKTRRWSESSQAWSERGQQGFSLLGFLCTLLVLGTAGLLALRAGPSLFEYWAIKKAVAAASAVSSTPQELRTAFDKMAAAGFVDTLQGKDLKVSGRGTDMRVDFSYEKRIPLFGPTSLLIEYQGSSADEAKEKAAD